MKRVLVWFVLMTGLVLLVSCTSTQQTQSPDVPTSQSPDISLTETPGLEVSSPTQTAKPATLSAWVTYWDMPGAMGEACELGDSLSSLSFFAAYFNAEGELFICEELSILFEESMQSLSDKSLIRYMTVVNDKLNSQGPASLKDTDLLYSLFITEDIITAHIGEHIAIAKEHGYDRHEIDYEGIRNDLTLWERFQTFLNRLNSETKEAGLSLRVLLEPSTPFEQIELPAGPEYVMMCYNLYGTHSGPGPKADADFIRKLAEKMSNLPGEKAFAIATGGFDWEGSNSVVSVTEAQATALQDNYSAQLCRDEASQCAVFTYRDEEDNLHEVWYADDVTLRYWANIIREFDNASVAIWRLGGNESLKNLIGE